MLMLKEAHFNPIQLLVMDFHSDMCQMDFNRAFANERYFAEFLQNHDSEYPTQDLIMVGEQYREIRTFKYSQELPLSVRFISFEDRAAVSSQQ